MAKRIPFGTNEIVILEAHEAILNQCSEGDVAISLFDGEGSGYGVTFVGKNMQLDGWDAPFDTIEEAVETIKSV